MEKEIAYRSSNCHLLTYIQDCEETDVARNGVYDDHIKYGLPHGSMYVYI